jgi:hypothetical protein
MRHLPAFISLCAAGVLWTACSSTHSAQQTATSAPAGSPAPSAQPSAMNPAQIDVYVTPYYSSKGPTIAVGRFTSGLESSDPRKFLATIRKMQAQWEQLTFPELYVASIRLYDLGYRNDAVYWFYTAEYRGRQFSGLLDPAKVGSMGSPAFELQQANGAFMQTAGTWINGYAFRDPDNFIGVVRRVRNEGRETIPNLPKIYPNVAFINPRLWPARNAKLAGGLSAMATYLAQHKDEIEKQRIASGSQATFSQLRNKELPKR